MSCKVVLSTYLPLKRFISGKVRDTYDLGDYLLIVASDRISAFDVVLPVGIPCKGKVLNQLSAFWFAKTAHIIPNHLVASLKYAGQLSTYLPNKQGIDFPSYLTGRSMVVKKLKRIPVECVVRGYLAGSGWAEYKTSQSICGIRLPPRLRQSEILPEPIFTPTTKGETEHDKPMTFIEVANMVGEDLAQKLKDTTIAVYLFARDYARNRGIIIADTKFEFGLDENGQLTLIDEALTPDSSRFWDIEKYEVGKAQESYDKQPVRDWLEASGWNKEPPAPTLPNNVIAQTSERYIHAYEALTGTKIQ